MSDDRNELAPSRRWAPFDDLDFLGPAIFRRMRREVPATRAELPNPAVDIADNETSYVVTAELPGCGSDDVSVEVHEGTLIIRGEKKSEREGEQEQTRWMERSFGSFHRSFRLPADASQDKVAATFKDGVLTIEIPKTEESKPRVVRIQS
jgi:HSP20 family protein